MRGLSLLALLSLSSPALADQTVNLTAGQVYSLAVTTYSSGKATVFAPGGSSIASASVAGDTDTGLEFVPSYTAAYTIHTEGDGTTAQVASDCAANVSTTCSLALNKPKQGRNFAWHGDTDAFRAKLAAGHLYRWDVTASYPCWQVRDRKGKVLTSRCSNVEGLTTFSYKAPRTDLFYVVLGLNGADFGGPYSVVMR